MWIKNPRYEHYLNISFVWSIEKYAESRICFFFDKNDDFDFHYDSIEARDAAWDEIIGSLQRNERNN